MTYDLLLTREDIPEDVKREINQTISAQKKTEESLIKTKKRLEKLLRSGPAIIYSCEPWGDYQTTFMSENVKEILGHNAQEFLVNPSFWYDGLHPEDSQRTVSSFSKISEKGNYSDVYRFQHKDGSYHWMLEEANLIRDEQGKPIEIVGYWTDFTVRKRVGEKLRESEEQYRTLFENIPIGLYRSTPDHKFLAANPTFIKQVGLTSFEELCGLNPDGLAARRNYPRDRFIKEINEKQEIKGVEFQLKRSDGTSLYIRENARAIWDSDGSILYYEGSVEDITDRIKTEEALRESEKKYKSLIDNLSDIVAETDSEGNFTFVSPQVLEILGYWPEETIGKNGFSFIHPDDLESGIEAMKTALEGKHVVNFEYRAKHKDGHFVPLSASGRFVTEGEDLKLTLVLRNITERRQTELALKESEEKYRSFVENFQGIAFKGYEDYSQDFFLGKVEEITGYTEDDFVSGRVIFKNLIHPEDSQRIANDVRNFHVSPRESTQREYRIINKYRNVHWLQEDIKKFYDEDKKKKGVFGAIQDITERREAEEALRKSEEKLRNLIEQSTDGIILANEEGEVIEWNKTMEEISGWKKEEVLGKYAWDVNFMVTRKEFKTNEHYNRDKTIFLDLLKKGETNTDLNMVEAEIITPKGNKRGIQYQIFPIRTSDGFMIGSILRDLTEWREMDRAKRESEERLRAFMDSAPDSILLLDSKLNIVEANKRALEGWNLTKNEIIAKSIAELRNRLRNQSDFEYAKKILQLTEVISLGEEFDEEFVVSHPKYDEGYISVKAFKVDSGLGIISRDITEQKQAELVRVELEQRRENFIYMASHELRTPLTVISGYCDFLKKHDKFLDQIRRDKIYSVMRSNINRLERITEDVTQVAQFDKDQFQLFKQKIDLCEFLSSSFDQYNHLLGEQFEDLGCVKELSIIINADPDRLQQVIENIISNALKHTPKDKRKIIAKTKLVGSSVQIAISDNGAGIKQEHLETIFEQFTSYQTDYAAGGTGIGLYLSRKILEAHGGSINAQSKGHGHGATFIIELPLKNS